MSPVEPNTIVHLSFEQLKAISAIERFTGQWLSFEKSESQTSLKQLSGETIVQSVIAAFELEGKQFTEDEIKTLVFDNSARSMQQEPDLQLALGYYEVLENIKSSYQDIEISEQSLHHLFGQLLKYKKQNISQRVPYKSARNTYELTSPREEATNFDTTPAPGIETEYAMRGLFQTFEATRTTHPLIANAAFIAEFLRIHPFQTSNVLISHLLNTLLLLKSGYTWASYVSFEMVLEHKKDAFLQALRFCQKSNTDGNAERWLHFYLQQVQEAQTLVSATLEQQKTQEQLTPRDKKIYSFIEKHPGCKSGQIATKLAIPLPTIKKLLADMSKAGLIAKLGVGAGTNYTAQKLRQLKTDVAIQLDEKNFLKTFILEDKYAYVSIKKIILSPRFEWKRPEEWQSVLLQQNLELKVKCITGKGKVKKQSYNLAAFVTDYHFQPVFTLNSPIHLPHSLWEQAPYDNEFRIKASIELSVQVEELKFDVTVVYDAGLV